jgi:hypothetical protein
MERAQGFLDPRQSESHSYVFGKRILTLPNRGKALLHQAPESAPAESAKTSVDWDHARSLFIDLFDLRVDQLQAAASLLSNLPEKVELGLILEPPVDPALVEPHDLEAAPPVIDHTVDDVHSAIRDSANPRPQHLSLEEHPGTRLRWRAQADDLRPVLVATRQMKQNVEHR